MFKYLKTKFFIVVMSFFVIFSSWGGDTIAVPNEKFDKDKFRSVLREYVFTTYKGEKGVHIESALSALGALSGFALQQGIREELIKKQGKPENKMFTIIKTKNGDKYYFGSIFDQPLYDTRKGKISVWAIIAGGAQKAGASSLPNINNLAKLNTQAVGSKNYGKLNISKKHQPKHHPIEAIKIHWGLTEKLLKAKGGNPLMWSWEIALVAQDLIILGKQAIQPSLAAQIVMEPAISMSKIDPNLIFKN